MAALYLHAAAGSLYAFGTARNRKGLYPFAAFYSYQEKEVHA